MDLITEIWKCLGNSRDQIVSIAAVLAAIFAFLGLRTWRAEIKGRSEYELAKKLLKSVYKVREAFYHVRHPAIYQYEYPKEMCDYYGHLEKEHDYEGTEHVYKARWKLMDDAFKKLENFNLDAQVEWGNEFVEIIVPLRECCADLLTAIQQHLRTKKKDRPSVDSLSKDEGEDMDDKLYFYGHNSEHEKFQTQINKAIRSFEDRLRPIISK